MTPLGHIDPIHWVREKVPFAVVLRLLRQQNNQSVDARRTGVDAWT